MSGLIERPIFKEKYENYINGKFVPPIKGNYFDNKSPIDGSQIASMPLSTAEDVEAALDAAHAAAESW